MQLLYGEEDFLIEREINRQAKQLQVLPIVFNGEDSLAAIIDEIMTVPLFAGARLVVVRNHAVLTDDALGKVFMHSVTAVPDDVHVLFVVDNKSLPSSAFVAFLRANPNNVKHFPLITTREMIPLIKQMVAEHAGTITNAAALRLATVLPENMRILHQEVAKLVMENQDINEMMVERSVGDYVKEDFFALSDALTAGDVRTILTTYHERKQHDEDPLTMIGQMAALFILALQVDLLRHQGLNSNDIADRLKIHAFRVRKAQELLTRTSPDKVRVLIMQLAELDAAIKKGLVDDRLGLDRFILETIR